MSVEPYAMPQPQCPKCFSVLPSPDEFGRVWCGFCCTLHELASGERVAPAAARIVMIDQEVLALVRQHFAGADAMLLAPNIPARTEAAARRTHAQHLPPNETILAVYDDTLFDSGDDGFVVTARRLCWKNEGEPPFMMEWRDLEADRLFADGKRLFLGGGSIVLNDEAAVDAAADAFHVLALSARAPSERLTRTGTQMMPLAPRRPSTRPTYRPSHHQTLESMVVPPGASASTKLRAASSVPPPVVESSHPQSYLQYAVAASSQPAPAYECWHCHAMIQESALRCENCTARPTIHGWKRTG